MLNLNKKILCLLTIFATGCSNNTVSTDINPDGQFANVLLTLMSDADSETMVIFNELYDADKAKLEAKKHCQKLNNGETPLNIVIKYDDSLREKVKEEVISEKEKRALVEIKNAIVLSAQAAYCPQDKTDNKVPLSERLDK